MSQALWLGGALPLVSRPWREEDAWQQAADKGAQVCPVRLSGLLSLQEHQSTLVVAGRRLQTL